MSKNSGNDGFGTFCRFAYVTLLAKAPNLEEKNTEKKFNEVRAREAIDTINKRAFRHVYDCYVDPL